MNENTIRKGFVVMCITSNEKGLKSFGLLKREDKAVFCENRNDAESAACKVWQDWVISCAQGLTSDTTETYVVDAFEEGGKHFILMS